MTFRLDFTHDPDEFLSVTRDYLAADPVLTTVVATVAARAAADRRAGVAVPEGDWYVTVHDGRGEVAGVGMRTAPFAPRPVYLLPMPDAATTLLAATLVERGEVIGAVNGPWPRRGRTRPRWLGGPAAPSRSTCTPACSS